MPNLLPAPEVFDAEHVEDRDLAKELEELREEFAKFRQERERDHQQIVALLKSGRIVFGDVTASSATVSEPVESDKWEKLKAKLGGKMAQIIDALQLTGTATRTQLRNQTGGALGTIDQAVYKLRDMGLLVKNGDGWSLKQ